VVSDYYLSKSIILGTSLIFVAYPEAISRMPLPWLWSFLFFCMLFLLGVASQFGMAEGRRKRINNEKSQQ
jgi:SNF family Na+-dependent transporter